MRTMDVLRQRSTDDRADRDKRGNAYFNNT